LFLTRNENDGGAETIIVPHVLQQPVDFHDGASAGGRQGSANAIRPRRLGDEAPAAEGVDQESVEGKRGIRGVVGGHACRSLSSGRQRRIEIGAVDRRDGLKRFAAHRTDKPGIGHSAFDRRRRGGKPFAGGHNLRCIG
jgi:hypothetical protein